MLKIAIVEDKADATELLVSYLSRYAAETGVKSNIACFRDGVEFIDYYEPCYDIIFMDIQMPHLNGMDAAGRLRKLDPKVMLIFVTSLAQYAVQGYSVNAFDYIVKPVGYYDFRIKMNRAVDSLPKDSGEMVLLRTIAGNIKLAVKDIRFVEVSGHHLVYHTIDGDYTRYATMGEAAKELASKGFSRIHSAYLVNLSYVKNVKGYVCTLDKGELPISRAKKQSFQKEMMQYIEIHS